MPYTCPSRLTAIVLAFTVAGAAGLTSFEADAATRHRHPVRNKVKFDKGSGETSKERDRRLERECRGRPNAGACLGFGQ